jgi:hypothetical protein
MAPQPVTKLACLKQGLEQSRQITVLYQAAPDSETDVLYASFPKDLAVALSPYIARALNEDPLNQSSVADLKPKPSSVTIKGGILQAHGEVLKWIFNCGKAGKTVTWHSSQVHTFYQYAMMVLSCEKLQVAYLPAQLMNRIENIASRQVHSVEVAKIFTHINGPHKIKQVVCESIANAMWENKCQAVHAYNELCNQEKFKEFADGLDAHYKRREREFFKTPEGKAAKKEQEEKRGKAKENRQAAKERRENNFKRAVARRHNVEEDKITPTGKGNYTLSTQGTRVRKGQGEKPGFVKLNLASLGITTQQFRAPESSAPPLKAEKVTSESDSGDKATAKETEETDKDTSNSKAEQSGAKSKGKGKGKAKAEGEGAGADGQLAKGMEDLTVAEA